MTELTGLSNLDLLGERPLSVVLKEFLQWVEATVHEVARHTEEEYFPVTTVLYYLSSSLDLLIPFQCWSPTMGISSTIRHCLLR